MIRKIVQIDEERCNGCGECITSCMEGALEIIDGKARLVKESYCDGLGVCLGQCPKDAIEIIEREAEEFDEEAVEEYLTDKDPGKRKNEPKFNFTQWPIQLNLLPINSPFFKDADLLLIADCVAVAVHDLHHKLIRNRVLVMGCPKFDDSRKYAHKLSEILRANEIKSITVAHMEVPCCSGLKGISDYALKESGKRIKPEILSIKIDGSVEVR